MPHPSSYGLPSPKRKEPIPESITIRLTLKEAATASVSLETFIDLLEGRSSINESAFSILRRVTNELNKSLKNSGAKRDEKGWRI